MIVTEWVHKLWFMGKQIRIWTQADPEFPSQERDNQKVEIEKILYSGTTENALKAMAGIPWVNAVEIMDATGTGRLIYPDWP